MALGIPMGGWCPRGRMAEDGLIAERYPMHETPLLDPAQRTEWNVRDSDGTLIIAPPPITGGTELTLETAERLDRPVLVIDPHDGNAAEHVQSWLAANAIQTLNIAGPRESERPGIYDLATALLNDFLR